MEQPKPRSLAARWSWSLLLLFLAAPAGLLQARAQPDTNGFISIDCGHAGSGYVDDTTKLSYVPDAAFTDGAGENHNIPPHSITPQLRRILQDVRSFPNGTRNCYTLRSLVAGNKYLLRVTFMYGNYDGLDKPPIFDLYIGVNLLTTVDSSGSRQVNWWEVIVVVPDDFLQVCLVNTGRGTPFISGIELRLLKSSLYPQVNATHGLNLAVRRNFGPTDTTDIVRYPDDPYDRIWYPKINTTNWNVTSTEKSVQNNNRFEVPSKVMQTAVTPRIASDNIQLQWFLNPEPNDPLPLCVHVLHFSELEPLHGKAVRQFDININSDLGNTQGFTPVYLSSIAIFNNGPYRGYTQYNATISATANSTLPPIINAYEIFAIIPTTNIGTEAQDVFAITVIKMKYGVTKNWMGDPCVADTFRWIGLTCNSASGPPRITGVDLSYNNLTGSIPDDLSQLPSLKTLYVSNPNLCADGDSCTMPKVKSKLPIYIVVPVALVLVLISVVVLFFLLRRTNQGCVNNCVKPRNATSMSHVPIVDVHSSLRLENRRFTYKELQRITNNFQHEIGRGGFGYVYEGFLEDGTQVAVKLRSESSNQGVKEFLTEAQILTRIHHKNLVSMIGYCKDGEYMALVYEYMSEGSLQEHITGKHLTWRQRLRIALESSQGLEYLHKGCNPPLIHRDVKTTNILLNAKLEAKVADFGLSRAFNRDIYTHVSTNTLVGTCGYVDPEYQATMQLTTKSDVFSFGVVLLELVTGKPAILRDPEPIGLIKWVQLRLSRGEIESVVDERMNGNHDINSVWKAADVALKCTVQASTQRPTMTDVVAQLQECLELEEGRVGSDTTRNFYTGSQGDLNSSYNANAYTNGASRSSAAFEMDEMMATGPATR
ncbi:hypothetical protein EJB05_35830, partial [Eragrostis curvula]